MSTPVAYVFADPNYQGASLALAEGRYDVAALTHSVGTDRISSLKVTSGYTVTLYTDAGFTGTSKTFSTDTPYVGDDINDQTSSVRVSAMPPVELEEQVVFVQPPSYQ